MADYAVVVQVVESNSENISITGLVNGRQVAAVMPVSHKPKKGGKAALDNFYAEALVDAYVEAPPPSPSAAAIMVTR